MPLTIAQHEKKLKVPAVCELLPLRDILDDVIVRTNGAFVAGYELRGIVSYFATDEDRNQAKNLIEALLRSIPDVSMRVQFRYEISEDLGTLLEDYVRTQSTTQSELMALDTHRLEMWQAREREGHYFGIRLHAYFIWDPRVHAKIYHSAEKKRRDGGIAFSQKKCIERARKEHETLLNEFESIMRGVAASLEAASLGPRRLNDQELFEEIERAQVPQQRYFRPLLRPEDLLEHRSVREQATVGNILNESETYLNIDGYLHSVVSLKELPDATFPGMLQRFSTVGFPIVVSGQVMIPDQVKVLKGYKKRLKKMIAAQKDSDGNHKSNPEAEIAQAQLMQVQRDIVSSSLKTAKLSLSVVVRTSRQAVTFRQLEEAEHELANRTQEVLNAFQRMNGAKAVVETIAKRRIFVGALPGMGETDKREQDMLTPNAADLIPTEMPWTGTRRSPLILFETPFRQLIPYSMFDPDLANANGLIMGTSGSGKTLIARSLAESMQCNYQQLSIADLKKQQLGASGERVREVWTEARNHRPAVIFLDECEGILGRRGAAETDVIAADIVQAFLSEWDGIAPNACVWVIGATNRRDMLDDAILSRFGWEMEIALPGPAERAGIFRQEMEAVFPGAVIPEEMASLTQGMSGRDLRHLASQVRTIAYPHPPQHEHYLEAVKSSRKAHNSKVDRAASWDTLVLEDGVLERLKLTCSLLRDAEMWRAKGVTVPRSLLLTGPPGVGKTEIARTLANEGGLGFLAATTADVKANFLGQSGNRVKQLFERARANAPVILFLDELDIIAPARSGSNDALTDEIVGQLLQELDGIQSRDSELFLLAATNQADQIDRAVLSRFQETLAIPLPDLTGRQRLLTVLLQKKRVAFPLEEGARALAEASEGKGMSGRDLGSWIGRAEQKALLRAIAAGGPEHFALTLADFDLPATGTPGAG